MTGTHGALSHAAIGMAIFGIAMLFIYPVILMLIGRSVFKFRPGYWRCFGAVILSGIIVGIIGFALRSVVPHSVMQIVAVVLNFVLVTLFLRAFVRQPDGGPLDWKKTALVVLIYAIIAGLISFGSSTYVHHLQATGQFPKTPMPHS